MEVTFPPKNYSHSFFTTKAVTVLKVKLFESENLR